jgi:hypothetical protein
MFANWSDLGINAARLHRIDIYMHPLPTCYCKCYKYKGQLLTQPPSIKKVFDV